jgi:cyclase
MKRFIVLAVLIIEGAILIAIARTQQQDATAIRMEKVKDSLYVVTGGRASGENGGISGNTTVFIADSGVVLVDTKYPGYGKAILDQVKSVTNKPVTMIINTHTHGDHTGSNNQFARSVDFVAQENTEANMARMEDFKGENAAFLPKKTFTDKMSLLSGKDRVDLYYFGAGHTNGDAVIVFPALRAAVMGDLFARKWAPGIDTGNGGSALAFPQTLAKAVAALKGNDAFITGHSSTTLGSGSNMSFVRSNPVMKFADLQEYADFTRDFVSAAQTAMKAGKSVDEAVSGLKLPEKYKDYNLANLKADVQRVYEESKR